MVGLFAALVLGIVPRRRDDRRSALTRIETEDSDPDLLEDRGEPTILLPLAGLDHDARELMRVPVTLLTAWFLPLKFRDRVLRDAEPP